MKMVVPVCRLRVFLCLLAAGISLGAAAGEMPSPSEMARFRHEAETLRGKKIQRAVPVRTITEAELRGIVDREVAKAYPGRKLSDLQALMSWVDLVPAGTDLVKVSADLMVDQVAGLYDSETKTMCIPSFQATNHPAADSHKSPSQKKVEELPGPDEGIVFTHEYTHALEDQYWPMDSTNSALNASTDREDAQSFLMEGSATRLMIEALPAELERREPGSYFLLWNLLHSGLGEAAMEFMLSEVWKGSEANVAGVPDTLSRGMVMPYSFGYAFCRQTLRDWGLDGLDYIYDHPPVSTEQVMHPQKSWAWRDLPVQITLPETLSGGWTRLIDETAGEAGLTLLFGCSLKNLNRGLRISAGWDGDRLALYETPEHRRLLVWASAWDSALAAQTFAQAWVRERRRVHHATLRKQAGWLLAWQAPDGRQGVLCRDGQRVVIFETDQPGALTQAHGWQRGVTFISPPEDAARAAVNHAWLRFNPVVAWRQDADYTVTRLAAGWLWRHDQNAVGAADRAALGLLGEWRRTSSLNKWRLGWGLVAKHETEARRGMTKTTLLPWGLLGSHFCSVVPYAPTNRLWRTTVLWGLAGTAKQDSRGRATFTVLPGGVLFRRSAGAGLASYHVLGTGYSRREKRNAEHAAMRVRLLGIPIWTRH